MAQNAPPQPSDSVGWPSALVAISLVALVAGVAIAAIVRYSVDDALKIWSALGPLVGLFTGAMVAYFFTRTTVTAARAETNSAKAETSAAKEETRRVGASARVNAAALQTIRSRLGGNAAFAEVAKDPTVQQAIATPPPPGSESGAT